MSTKLTVEDYRLAAKRRLPRVIFDYVDGAAETESTMRANIAAFEAVKIRPRHAVQVNTPDVSTTVLGHPISLPILLGPCGMARVIAPGGDVAAARAANRAGVGFTLTTMSGHSLEEVAAVGAPPLFYQVYRVGERERVEHAIARATASNYDGLVITIDTMRNGLRNRDRRNGTYDLLSGDLRRMLPHVPQLFLRPRWFARRIADGLIPNLENVILEDGRPQKLGRGPRARSLTWEDMAWIKEVWSGPVIVKGVLTGEDARRALDSGAEAIVVSNHGGRQIDGTEATLVVLDEVLEAVAGRCEVLIDSGVRLGLDVIKAVAVGARAVLIGRAWCYGLATAGESGIEDVLAILREEISQNLELMGCASIRELDRSYVRVPPEWSASPS